MEFEHVREMQAAPRGDRSLREGKVIAVQGLTKHYGSVHAVAGVDFEVGPGRVLGLLGPNGAGKSTTLRMMLGLTKPTAGRTTFDGVSYADLRGYPMHHVGATLSSDTFAPRRTARQHLWAWAPVAGADTARIDGLLEMVGLAKDARRPVGQFSLGMRQRLALAAALLGDPGVLVLDEPANGLDPYGIFWLRRFLRQFADDGGTVVLSSHLLREVEQMVDDVVLIDRGRVVWASEMAALAEAAGWSVVLPAVRDEAMNALRTQGITCQPFGCGLRVFAPPDKAAAALRGVRSIPGQPLVLEGNLESFFLALTDQLGKELS